MGQESGLSSRYLEANIRYSAEKGITHGVLDIKVVGAGVWEMVIFLDENRHFDESMVLIAQPLSTIIGQVELNRITAQTVIDEQPHILIRIGLLMPHIDDHSKIAHFIGNRIIEMRYRIGMPFTRWNRGKLTIDNVVAAGRKEDS